MNKPVEKGLFADLENIIEFAQDGIVSKTLIKEADKEVGLFCMFAGQSLSSHTSSFSAVIHVLKGKGKITLEKRSYEGKPNAWFYLPANLPHAVVATENLVFLLTLFK